MFENCVVVGVAGSGVSGATPTVGVTGSDGVLETLLTVGSGEPETTLVVGVAGSCVPEATTTASGVPEATPTVGAA